MRGDGWALTAARAPRGKVARKETELTKVVGPGRVFFPCDGLFSALQFSAEDVFLVRLLLFFGGLIWDSGVFISVIVRIGII